MGSLGHRWVAYFIYSIKHAGILYVIVVTHAVTLAAATLI